MNLASVAGRACGPDEGVDAAVELIRAARRLLVWGLVDSTVEAQREACRIAELTGAALDHAASPGRAGAVDAFARVGLLTTSLGEARERADLVVFWGCDPDLSQPGFVARYVPARAGRLRLAVDVGVARGPAEAEERLAAPPESEIEALLVLRAFVRGRRVEPESAGALAPLLPALRSLATRLAGCSYGVVFHEGDPVPERRNPERAWAVSALVRDAHRKARLRSIAVRRWGNAVGAENVLTWRTGFPGAIRFTGGEAQRGPGDLTGEALLARGDADGALIVGANPPDHLSARALAHLRRIPTVRLGVPDAADAATAQVVLATAPLATTAGTVFRMDGVALPQRPAVAHPLPTEAAVLARIFAGLWMRAAGASR